MLEQQRQGVITRQLAAWAAILAVPTAIAGIYGMNFEFMPELDWAFGYPFALALIFGGSGLVFWRFKHIGWPCPLATAASQRPRLVAGAHLPPQLGRTPWWERVWPSGENTVVATVLKKKITKQAIT